MMNNVWHRTLVLRTRAQTVPLMLRTRNHFEIRTELKYAVPLASGVKTR